MQHFFRVLASLGVMVLILHCVTGCVQMPTEKSGITDIRPQISLRPVDDSVRASRVFVDGLEMGAVSDFMEGTAALRVVPGTHVIKIINQGRTILDEKFYAGDGINRTFIVNRGF
jgi:hypothetical protein